jgi:site-specific DNA-methyltransferase (adenine-specific)
MVVACRRIAHFCGEQDRLQIAAEGDRRANHGPMSKETLNLVYHGDCLKLLPTISAESADLIMTSPPYADCRRNSYGGVAPAHYSDGSFVLNIKERVVKGERSTYVAELILAMRKQGWLWTEEYIWHKRNCFPGKWPNRFRDAWEHCYHFTKQRRFRMYQDAVTVPMGNWANHLRRLSSDSYCRRESTTGSSFGMRLANYVGRDRAYPTNVLHLATECGNKDHSAAFPIELPRWFIKLFTQEGDVVLDPFLGSGTTALAAHQLNRNYVGMEVKAKYCDQARRRLEDEALKRTLTLPACGQTFQAISGNFNPVAPGEAGPES